MTTNIKRLFIGVAACAAAAAIAPAASAACGMGAIKDPTAWRAAPNDGPNPLLVRAAWGPPIVGMWDVKLYAGANLIDWGYSQWHSDGTELMNSGGHSPASGNFCMGVWAQTGGLTYRLNHIALGYNPVTGAFASKVNLKEDVALDPSGASFAGTFTLDAYDPSGNLQAHIAGRITGRRVTVF